MMVLTMFSMPIGSSLTQRNINPRLLILLGGVVAFTCLYLASFMESFVGFSILFVVGFAFNQGIAYLVPVHHGWLWWPQYPGLVSGIILSGFGVGGLIFDPVFTVLINPDNKSVDKDGFYPPEVDGRFISAFRIVVSIWLLIATTALIMIFPGPVKEKETSGEEGRAASLINTLGTRTNTQED